MVYPRSIKSPSLETSRLIEIITSDKADHSSRSSQVDNQTDCLMPLLLKLNVSLTVTIQELRFRLTLLHCYFQGVDLTPKKE